MKILQLSPKPPFPLHDGGAIAAWNLTRGLSLNGCSVTVLNMNTDKHFTNIKDLPQWIRETSRWESVNVNTRLDLFKALTNLLFSRKPYNVERFHSIAFKKALKELLQEEPFDVVQCEGLQTAIYIPVIRKYSKAHIAYRAHNIESEIWERKARREKRPLRHYYYSIIAKRLLNLEENLINHYDLLIPITGRDAEVFRLMGNKKPVCIIPSGFNIDMMPELPAPAREMSIGFIGSLDWTPNQEGLLWFLEKVWKPMTSKPGYVKLHIAGRNAPPWLEKILSSTYDLVYEGEVEDAQTFMMEHPILIVPLFAGSGMRVKIVEGMALGRLIVSTPIGIEGLPVTHRKDILVASTAKEYQELLSEVIANPSEYVHIGEAARRLIAEKFNNLSLGKTLVEFYSENLK